MNNVQVRHKIYRMALEIIENNFYYPTLVMVSINEKASIVANLLKETIESKSTIKVVLIRISVTNDHVQAIDAIDAFTVGNAPVILCDDVANSGKTLAYAFQFMMQYQPLGVQTLVLAERSHKLFPIAIDYKGMSINTTVEEHIDVIVHANGDIEALLF